MFITATANYFHSSSTRGWFLILFTSSSQAGSGLSQLKVALMESSWLGLKCTRTNLALGWPTRVLISGSWVWILSSQQGHLQPAHSASGHRVLGYLRWTQEYMTPGHLSFQNANYCLWKKSRVEGKLCVCVIFKDLQIIKITWGWVCQSASHRTELTLILFILKAKHVENPR